MDTTYAFPKLRWPLDLKLEKVADEEAVIIRCPLGIVETPLLLIPAVAPLLNSFTGTHSFEAILNAHVARGLTAEVLQELIRVLDEHFFLANTRFFAEEARVKDEFRQAVQRRPFLAGLSYSADAGQLGSYIDSLVVSNAEKTQSPSETLCVMAPHIDYYRGEKGYAGIYSNVKALSPDLIILIGTSHQWSKGLFHLTKKDFVSPLGVSVCDGEFVEKLAHIYGIERSFNDELLHRKEHSLELQLPFLHRIFPNAKVVPILVGGFHEMVINGSLPGETAEYADFVGALSELFFQARSTGRKSLFVAGVDMAHVGQYFGDKEKLSPAFMEEVERRDKEYLRVISQHNKEALFDHISSDHDARKICGFPTMYTILEALELGQSKVSASFSEYHQSVNYTSDCAVTFAGMQLNLA